MLEKESVMQHKTGVKNVLWYLLKPYSLWYSSLHILAHWSTHLEHCVLSADVLFFSHRDQVEHSCWKPESLENGRKL